MAMRQIAHFAFPAIPYLSTNYEKTTLRADQVSLFDAITIRFLTSWVGGVGALLRDIAGSPHGRGDASCDRLM
jgi:hypothetical protein